MTERSAVSRFGMIVPTPLPVRVGAMVQKMGRAVIAQELAGLGITADEKAGTALRERGDFLVRREARGAVGFAAAGIAETLDHGLCREAKQQRQDDEHGRDISQRVQPGVLHADRVHGDLYADGERHGDDDDDRDVFEEPGASSTGPRMTDIKAHKGSRAAACSMLRNAIQTTITNYARSMASPARPHLGRRFSCFLGRRGEEIGKERPIGFAGEEARQLAAQPVGEALREIRIVAGFQPLQDESAKQHLAAGIVGAVLLTEASLERLSPRIQLRQACFDRSARHWGIPSQNSRHPEAPSTMHKAFAFIPLSVNASNRDETAFSI